MFVRILRCHGGKPWQYFPGHSSDQDIMLNYCLPLSSPPQKKWSWLVELSWFILYQKGKFDSNEFGWCTCVMWAEQMKKSSLMSQLVECSSQFTTNILGISFLSGKLTACWPLWILQHRLIVLLISVNQDNALLCSSMHVMETRHCLSA